MRRGRNRLVPRRFRSRRRRRVLLTVTKKGRPLVLEAERADAGTHAGGGRARQTCMAKRGECCRNKKPRKRHSRPDHRHRAARLRPERTPLWEARTSSPSRECRRSVITEGVRRATRVPPPRSHRSRPARAVVRAARGLMMTVDRFDLRDGGTWRFTSCLGPGEAPITPSTACFGGAPVPRRHRRTLRVRGQARAHLPCGPSATFSERDGARRRLTHNTVYQSVEDRDLDHRSRPGGKCQHDSMEPPGRTSRPARPGEAGDQRSGITRILSSSGPGLPRPSRLLVVHHSEPSGARTTARSLRRTRSVKCATGAPTSPERLSGICHSRSPRSARDPEAAARDRGARRRRPGPSAR